VTALAVERDRRRLQAWHTALASEGIASALEASGQGWALLVPDDQVERARAVIELYEAENAPVAAGARPASAPEWGASGAAIVAAVALAPAWAYTSVRPVWLARGRADAARLLDGDWWRALTALTLHGDAGHLVANVLFLGLFGTLVCRVVGPGVGLAGILAAGALGNLLNALARASTHRSIGASTAVFGAVGLLAALRFAREERTRMAWHALGAALALVAMLGADPQTDVGAHWWGLVAGLGIGAALARSLAAAPGPLAQSALVAGAALSLTAAWWAALR
jgi:membrane associated rhomboid family serine protease